MRAFLMASVASVIGRAFMSDVCETVQIKGDDGQPLRVNKSAFDADQAGDKTMKLYTKDKEGEQSIPGGPVPTTFPEGVPITAAPAAPDFSPPADDTPPPIDERKNAVAPTAPSANTPLVAHEGTGAKKRFYVVDGTGAKIAKDGIDTDGYKTEAEAWNAIMALPH